MDPVASGAYRRNSVKSFQGRVKLLEPLKIVRIEHKSLLCVIMGGHSKHEQ